MASPEIAQGNPENSQPQETNWEDLFHEIKEINGELKSFYDARDFSLNGRLTDTAFKREKALIAQKGELFVDLLSLKNAGDIPYKVPSFIIQDKNEILHPFSQNIFSLHIPVPEEPKKAITAKIKLAQLRKPGHIITTDQALALIGDYDVLQEDPQLYLERSLTEVNMVHSDIKHAMREGAPDEIRHYLNRLQAHLLIDRFIGVRRQNALPTGYQVGVGFLSATKLRGQTGAHLVEVMVQRPDLTIQTFTMLPPHAYNHVPEIQEKLERSLSEIGGYDYYNERRPR